MSTTDPLTTSTSSNSEEAAPDPSRAASEPAQWHTATVSTLAEVEELLVRAEQAGHHEHELTVLGPNVYVVRWR
jgi:hypothetical protein